MLASRWLSGDEKKGNSILEKIGRAWDRGFEKLKSAYVKVLTWSLRWRLIVVLLGIVSFATGIGMVVFGLVSTELLPQADQNEFTIIAEMPAGTTLSETDRAVAKLEEELAGWPAIDSIFTFVGTSGTASVADSRFARITVKLAPKDRRNQSAMELADRVRRLEGSTPGLRYRVELPNVAGPSGPPIQIRVRGDHPTVLVELAREVQGIVNDTRGAIDVRNSGEIGDPELEIVLDRSQVADLGLSPAQVASAVRTSLAGTVATQFRPANDSEVDVRVTAFGEDTASIEAIKSIPLASVTGEVIRLDQIASVRQKSGPSRIERYDRQRVITVSADTSGRAQGDVASDIQRELDRLTLPPGYSITFGGSTQAQEESFTQLFQALALGSDSDLHVASCFVREFPVPIRDHTVLAISGCGRYRRSNSYRTHSQHDVDDRDDPVDRFGWQERHFASGLHKQPAAKWPLPRRSSARSWAGSVTAHLDDNRHNDCGPYADRSRDRRRLRATGSASNRGDRWSDYLDVVDLGADSPPSSP